MKRTLALLLAAIMCLGMFAGCKGNGDKDPASTDNGTGTTAPVEQREQNLTPLVVGYSAFNEKFSPFFAESAYDQDVMELTQIGLLGNDRQGAIIMKGIEGETREYNGHSYTYTGASDCKITENTDGTVTYAFKLREGMTFSDGKPVTVDDVIFSMYVLCDPTYDGSSTLFAVPIKGMDEYRAGMTTLSKYFPMVGRDKADLSIVTAEQQTAFWKAFDEGLVPFAQAIVDYCVEAGANEAGDIAGAAANWGFDGLKEDATVEDFAMAIGEKYSWVFSAMEAETAGVVLSEVMDKEVYNNYPTTAVKYGDSAASISGIEKQDDYNMTVTLTQVDATAIYQLGVTVAPMHYYGDEAQFDYANNKFGFPKGDLSVVRAKTTTPMGAGPYKFIKYENGVVSFESNDTYYKGRPVSKYINFKECISDDDKLNGVTTGTIDITDPAFSGDTVEAVEKENSNKSLTGDKITTSTVDNLGYGYLGMSANRINVAGKPGSDASKYLRKALATVLAVYRDVAVESYYGERASVINYPISNTSWAAPQPTDDGYKVAFSVDADGKDIYTSGMTAEQKYDAALKAALGFFEKAGYTVTDGKLTAAPEGAKLEYEVQIPADGKGNHPSFMMLTEAEKAFAKIGMKLIVTDLTDSRQLWTDIEAENVDMWCAAWQATIDPDMYQIYYADVANNGAAAGGSNYMYDIADAELDKLVMDARKSLDQNYRKTVYKACLDIVVDWAVEVPVYQRQNAIIFSTERVDISSVTPDITTFYGWDAEIENVQAKAK